MHWLPSRRLTDLATPTVETPSAPTERAASIPFVSGGRLRWSLRGLVAVSTLLAFCLLPVRGLYRATGSSMEEGFMLVFPKLVQQGKVPNVDFLHLYGPGSLDLLAGWYRVFGYTLEAERTFGLLQNLGIVFAVYALTRTWGRVTAVGAGVIAALLIMTPIGLSALAWHGAVAMAMWALVFALRARHTARTVDWAVAGILAGLALTFRPDIILALSAALLCAVWAHRRTGLRPLIIATIVGLIPMWIHLVVAGPWNVVRRDRARPGDPSASRTRASGATVVGQGRRCPAGDRRRRRTVVAPAGPGREPPALPLVLRRGPDRRRRPGVGVVATSPRGSRRAQHGAARCRSLRPRHPAPSDAAAGFDPPGVGRHRFVAAARRLDRRRPQPPRAHRTWTPGVIGTGVVLALMLVIAPFYTYRSYLLHTRVSVGNLPLPFLVERDGRRFWFSDPNVATAFNDMIVELDALTEPGDRLIVGTADLSRTVYNDVSVYYLFPELTPGTYFVEMDPGIADTAGSGLAEDIEAADYLVLTNIWGGWVEPNATMRRGSQEANQAVADNFCLVRAFEENLVMIFERCEGGGGISPADVPGRFPEIPPVLEN